MVACNVVSQPHQQNLLKPPVHTPPRQTITKDKRKVYGASATHEGSRHGRIDPQPQLQLESPKSAAGYTFPHSFLFAFGEPAGCTINTTVVVVHDTRRRVEA